MVAPTRPRHGSHGGHKVFKRGRREMFLVWKQLGTFRWHGKPLFQPHKLISSSHGHFLHYLNFCWGASPLFPLADAPFFFCNWNLLHVYLVKMVDRGEDANRDWYDSVVIGAITKLHRHTKSQRYAWCCPCRKESLPTGSWGFFFPAASDILLYFMFLLCFLLTVE
jgi:hypothetical protein